MNPESKGDDFERVLSFWFGELDERGRADAEHSQRWWNKDPAFDQSIREHFLAVHGEIVAGRRDNWLATPRGRLAYVIVLDQFSRNMFRGTPAMFDFDPQALRAALDGIARGDDRVLRADEVPFLYLPLMHAEDLGMQQQSVKLFTALRDAAPEAERKTADLSLDFAVRHHDIVAQFGRFPHRNTVLGRTCTADEIEFLTQPGSSF